MSVVRRPSVHAVARWVRIATTTVASLLSCVSIARASDPAARQNADAGATPRVNLLILAIDTLRADHVGCYGAERPVTPNIDALAGEGIRFARALSNAPWTLPSFATMFTGRVPSRHGAGMVGPVRNLSAGHPQAITPQAPTLAEVLHKAGYRTGGVASNPYLLFGIERGFDSFSCKVLSADRIGALARLWISQQTSDMPFFLFVHFNDPHEPTNPPHALVKAIGAEDSWSDPHRKALERWGGDPEAPTYLGRQESAQSAAALLRTKLALYDASIYHVDLEIGLIVRQLARQQLLDRTLIVVVSDHGEEFLEHAGTERAHDLDPRGIWGIGHGHTLFDELLHVPLIFRGPGLEGLALAGPTAGSGKVVPQQFPLTELMPTLLGLLGVPAPAGMDGIDRRDWLADPERAPIPAPVEGIAYGPDLVGWCDGQSKLITQRIGSPLWGFDLQRDPREQRNLLSTSPRDSMPSLHEALLLWTDRVAADAPTPASATMTPEMERALRALGYVQ